MYYPRIETTVTCTDVHDLLMDLGLPAISYKILVTRTTETGAIPRQGGYSRSYSGAEAAGEFTQQAVVSAAAKRRIPCRRNCWAQQLYPFKPVTLSRLMDISWTKASYRAHNGLGCC